MRYATALASRLGAQIQFLHVVEDPFVTGAWTSDVYLPDAAELIENLCTDADRRLTPFKEAAAQQGVTAETAVVRGRPADAIVEHAASGGVDLIVMSTHGRTGLAHVVMEKHRRARGTKSAMPRADGARHRRRRRGEEPGSRVAAPGPATWRAFNSCSMGCGSDPDGAG